jgi:hypothetical protein
MGEFSKLKPESNFGDSCFSKPPISEAGLSPERLAERFSAATASMASALSEELGIEVPEVLMRRFSVFLEQEGHSIHLDALPNRDERATRTLERAVREISNQEGLQEFYGGLYVKSGLANQHLEVELGSFAANDLTQADLEGSQERIELALRASGIAIPPEWNES